MPDGTIVVLRRGVHGLPVEAYVEAIRERLPGWEVHHARTPAEERALVRDAAIVTGHSIDESVLAEATELDLFAGVFAGVDHLPLEGLAERGVAVTNAAGVHGPNVAEHVVGSVLAFAAGLHTGWRRQRDRQWRHYPTRELAGSTVTVVGLGHIGRAVLERLGGFDVETLGVRHTPGKGGPADEVVGYDPDDVHAVLARTDYLALTCPLTETTRGLIDAAALESLPPRAVIVNVARGPVVDTEALIAALQREDVAGAALDVTDPEPLPPESPLWGFDNVLITPHVAGYTPTYYDRVADILAENARRLGGTDETGDLRNLVVAPGGSTAP